MMNSRWRIGRRRLNRRRRRVTTRRLTHRRGVRRTLRLVVGGRAVNFLGQAIMAFKRAARAHRRLIKLAPEQYDTAVMDRLAIEQAEWASRQAEATAAMDKVYGPRTEKDQEPDQGELFFRYGNGMETVWFSNAKRAAVARWEAEWRLWLEVGREALARHQRFQPHRYVGLSQIAGLMEISSVLGRLATGSRPYE